MRAKTLHSASARGHRTRPFSHAMKAAISASLTALVLASGCATTENAADHHGGHDAHASKIDWQDWTPEAFAKAKESNRLLLVTVVTTWCHWCHVMDEKTWGNDEIAALLNEHFVVMRVDADSRPDVAERYAEWAWPATAIMTPDAGGVVEIKGYKNPDAMKELLRGIVDDHRAGRKVARREAPQDPTPVASAELAEVHARVIAQLDRFYDEKQGGWGRGKQKYPLAAPLELSFRRAARGEAPKLWRERAVFTLRQQQKITDPVDGGMYQYSVFGDWDHAHFEKLAFIQGWALSNYAEGYAATGDEGFRTTAEGVVAYVRNFLWEGEGGAFYANQDADVGTRGERPFVVGKDYYALSNEERRKRGAPFVDKNVYASHSGEIILGLADFAAATGDAEALAMASNAVARLGRTHNVRGGYSHAENDDSGRLFLADQVAMGRALLRLHEVSADDAFLAKAREVASVLTSELEAEDGGFFAHTLVANDVTTLKRRKPFKDNAKAARFLLRLAQHTKAESPERKALRDSAERAIKAFAAPAFIKEQYRMVGDYALALEDAVHEPFHLTVVGTDDDATMALYQRALRVHAPGVVIERAAPGERFPDLGRPAAFVCTESFCSQPLFDTETFADKVQKILAPKAKPQETAEKKVSALTRR